MGFEPPPDLPEPVTIGGGDVSAGLSFAPSPSGILLCGFLIPGFAFSLSFSFKLPSFDFPPIFFFALSLKCDLSNPIDADFGFGGGRQGNPPPEDTEYG